MDIRVEHFLAGFVTAERRDRQQHRDDAEIDGGDAAERVVVVRGGGVGSLRLMDALADFMCFDHFSSSLYLMPPTGLWRRGSAYCMAVSRWARDSARPETWNTLACAPCRPRERCRSGLQLRQNRETGAETDANGH